MQPGDVNLRYFKFRLHDITEFYGLKYLRSTTLGCKDRGIKISEYVGKTQFLCSKHKDDFQVVEYSVVMFCAYYGSAISSPGNLKVTLP